MYYHRVNISPAEPSAAPASFWCRTTLPVSEKACIRKASTVKRRVRYVYLPNLEQVRIIPLRMTALRPGGRSTMGLVLSSALLLPGLSWGRCSVSCSALDVLRMIRSGSLGTCVVFLVPYYLCKLKSCCEKPVTGKLVLWKVVSDTCICQNVKSVVYIRARIKP
jgi:hypothetical protein